MYRWNGLGDQLRPAAGFGQSAQGLTFVAPLGRRRAWAAVLNAKTQLARDKELLSHLQRELILKTRPE